MRYRRSWIRKISPINLDGMMWFRKLSVQSSVPLYRGNMRHSKSNRHMPNTCHLSNPSSWLTPFVSKTSSPFFSYNKSKKGLKVGKTDNRDQDRAQPICGRAKGQLSKSLCWQFSKEIEHSKGWGGLSTSSA